MSTYKPKSNKEIITNARGQLIGKYQVAILASLLVTCIIMVVTSISDANYTGSISSYLIRFLITLVVDLLSGVLVFGQSRFFLNLVRGENNLSPGDIFYGIKNNTDKAIMIQLVFTLTTFVTSLPAILMSLGIINVSNSSYLKFGIIFSLVSYIGLFAVKLFFGLCFYILNDNPDMAVMDIYKESLRLMEQRKLKYITLCLSVLPLLLIGFCACFVGVFWFVAFFQTLNVNFYLDAIGEEPFNPLVEKVSSYTEESERTDASDTYFSN